MIDKLKSISKIQILAIILIVVGLFVTVRYSIRAFSAYREVQFAIRNNFEAGNPDPDLVRPWMNIPYIAVAYTVPQEYLFDALGIEMAERTINAPLHDLNDLYFEGRRAEAGYPIVVDEVRAAIVAYRENPVPTGLRKNGVRHWMSIQYIANTTGIPAEEIFEQIGVPPDDHAFMPLYRLDDDIGGYPGGLRRLVEEVQRVVDQYEATQ